MKGNINGSVDGILTFKDKQILANLQTFRDQQILKSRSCQGSGDCKSCNLSECYYNETGSLEQLNNSNENRLTRFLKDFKEHPERYHESKRIYRCPNCDAQVLDKVSFNSLHYCSCGAFNHAKNLKLEFEEMC